MQKLVFCYWGPFACPFSATPQRSNITNSSEKMLVSIQKQVVQDTEKG